MTTNEIANRLVQLCRTGQYVQAHEELYADDAWSVEPAHVQMPEVRGKEALKQKGQSFSQGILEVHREYVSDPLVAGNYITLIMGMDVTMKDGNRMNMDEVVVYEVRDGKIMREQFLF